MWSWTRQFSLFSLASPLPPLHKIFIERGGCSSRRGGESIYFFPWLEARRSISSCVAFSLLVIMTEVSPAKTYIITIFLLLSYKIRAFLFSTTPFWNSFIRRYFVPGDKATPKNPCKSENIFFSHARRESKTSAVERTFSRIKKSLEVLFTTPVKKFSL